MTKRIGILTGGGDVPGLNSVIKEVVYRGSENNCEIFGIRRGWEGLTHPNLEEQESRVVFVGGNAERGQRVGVEFLTPAPRFWGVEFPPPDWPQKSAAASSAQPL